MGWKNKAIKKMIAKNKNEFDLYMNEVKIMKLNGIFPNLMSICFSCCFYTEDRETKTVYLIMDKKEGSLHDVSQSETFHWKTSRLWRVDMMMRMARSVFTLQQNGIIHTDLKLENFLMDNMYYPILSDFGFSFYEQDYKSGKIKITSLMGTKTYIAPELYELREDGSVNYTF